MKAINILKTAGFLVILLAFTFCESDTKPETTSTDLFPTSFKVDIPSSISQSIILKSANSDDFSGENVYQHLSNFIHIGESAAEFVEEIMKAISTHGLNRQMEITFFSEDDNRKKNIVVIDNSDFEGVTWQHQLTLTDAASEGNSDGGKALQVFWSTNPVRGMAILNPGNWDVNSEEGMKNAIFKIEYSEAGENGYEAEMTVSITNFEQNMDDRFHMDNLKMFVGKTGDIVDVYGNSNHPDAYLFLEEPKGFSWAFVAAGNNTINVGVAEVGLPLSSLNETARQVILVDNSVKNIFTEQITKWALQTYPDADSAAVAVIVADLLVDTEAPGFFNSAGFIQGGEAPNNSYNELVSNIELLTPYNPFNISELIIEFK